MPATALEQKIMRGSSIRKCRALTAHLGCVFRSAGGLEEGGRSKARPWWPSCPRLVKVILVSTHFPTQKIKDWLWRSSLMCTAPRRQPYTSHQRSFAQVPPNLHCQQASFFNNFTRCNISHVPAFSARFLCAYQNWDSIKSLCLLKMWIFHSSMYILFPSTSNP